MNFFMGEMMRISSLRPRKKNDERSGYKVLNFCILSKMNRQKATEDEAGKNTQSTEGGNREMMHFPGIGHIEQLFHFSHIDNGWNSKKSNGKRNSYRK